MNEKNRKYPFRIDVLCSCQFTNEQIKDIIKILKTNLGLAEDTICNFFSGQVSPECPDNVAYMILYVCELQHQTTEFLLAKKISQALYDAVRVVLNEKGDISFPVTSVCSGFEKIK